MININLIPPQLKKKKSSKTISSKVSVPLEYVVGIAGGLVGVLILVHIFMLVINIAKIIELKKIESKFATIKPDKDKAESIMNLMRSLQGKSKSIQDITGKRKILWAQKLNILSDSLSAGAWINRIILDEFAFIVEGKALAKKNDMRNIHLFANNLKSNKDFLTNFEDLDLSSIQLKKVGSAEVADFLITCRLPKAK